MRSGATTRRTWRASSDGSPSHRNDTPSGRSSMIVDVNLGARSYQIVVERGARATVGARLKTIGVGSRTALLSAAAILHRHGKTVTESLEKAGYVVATIELPDGEAAKTLAVAERCWNAFLDAGLDRTSTVLALGGGAV